MKQLAYNALTSRGCMYKLDKENLRSSKDFLHENNSSNFISQLEWSASDNGT